MLTVPNIATHNLVNEGITGEKVQQVGDVMHDAVLYYGKRAEQRSRILDTLGLTSGNYILATLHRAENTDSPERMRNILTGFAESPIPIIWALHPRTRKRLLEFELPLPSSVQLIEPVGYLDMIMLEKHAALIATDSGGVQKEAYFHRIPCITLREETEWVDLVEMKVNHLVDPTLKVNINMDGFDRLSWRNGVYGNGKTGDEIAHSLTV